MKRFSALANLFGRAPSKPIQEHMTLAVKAAAELTGFFEAVTSDDWEQARQIQQRVTQFGQQANELKKELRVHIPKRLFLPLPRTDLLELLASQDRLPNRAKDIAGIIIGRRMSIPSSMHEEMNEFVQASVAAAEQALVAISEFDKLIESGFDYRELSLISTMIKQLDELEEKSDRLEIGVRTSLFALETQLPPVDVMFLYNIIDWVGDIANRAHDVGGRLHQLSAR